MTARSDAHASDSPRLTPVGGALLVAATLAVFVVAYAVGSLFGRAADDTLDGAGARVVAAREPSGTPLLTVRAKNVAFDTREITLPAGQPVLIRLENEDAGILHNIAVYRDPQASELVARGKLFDGPRTRDYHFEGIPVGTYYFQCDLHPSMNGTLVSRE